MKRILHFIVPLFIVGMVVWVMTAQAEETPQKIKVLVFTGGHDFEPSFYTIFDHPDMEYTKVEHPKANAVFADGTAQKYDVIVLYDLWQDITDEQKQGFLAYLKSGKGLVSLHHSIANYQDWPEYLNITGTSYILDAKGKTIQGKEFPQSKYQHDVWMDIAIADANHPITQGLGNFKIMDEAYNDYYVSPNAHMLLTTDNPLNEKSIAWTMNYENNEVVFIQLGHDKKAFDNQNYRHLVAQAIRWTAKRPTAQPLFHANDLEGFQAEGNAVWKMEEGVMIGRQNAAMQPGDLFTKASYTDFTLSLEFKVQWPANSGVWFRYQEPQTSYQADILEYKDPVCWAGSLYCPKNGPFLALNENPQLIDRDGWNSFIITCQGDHLTITLNGTKTADVHDSTSAEGKIGFQVHPGDEFKDMEIRVRNAFILPLQ